MEYRHYDAVELMGYVPATPSPSAPSIIGTLNTLGPSLVSYFNGNNTAKQSIPLTRPVGIELVDFPGYGYMAIPFMFIPAGFQGDDTPIPNDANVRTSGPIPSGSFDPIVLSFTDSNVTDTLLYQYASELKSICAKHGQTIVDYIWFYFTYQTTDTKTWPNEVWVLPVDSLYAQQRMKGIQRLMSKQSEAAE